MRTYSTDNRWSPGASEATIPDTARVAYSARWIDRGARADIVPDRQGFAYNDPTDRAKMADAMARANLLHISDVPRDVTVVRCCEGFDIGFRRAGGYVYVDAWVGD